MSVDMFERRFRKELEKLPEFEPNDVQDSRVWKVGFPAWHALFSAMCLFGHSTGYRLPSFDEFFRYCYHAYAVKHPKRTEYAPLFDGELLPGMMQRVSAWYESGMAETYLYACLAEAVEDRAKSGIVLYDPRADWKLKADVIVIARQRPVKVSAFFGEQSNRPELELQRDVVEQERKKNTRESAHWNNTELDAMPVFTISRTADEMQIVNGVRLFSLPAVNRLLSEIYHATGAKGWLFPLS